MKKLIILIGFTRANKSLVKKALKRKSGTKYFILMSSTPMALHTITAVLDVPNGYLQKGEKATFVITKCTSNAWVAIVAADIAIYLAHIATYNGATTTSARDTAWKVVHKDLKKIMRLFQDAADVAPADAITIIESGGFRVKKVAIHQEQVFELRNGVDSGVVDLIGDTERGQHCHDWWYSPDGITFTRMRPTLESTTQMTGLEPGKMAWFMHECIVTKDGKGLSKPLFIMVK